MPETSATSPLPYRALLLLGPTGAGKTPLGEELARRGFRQRPCVHFDFGAQLRQIVAAGRTEGCLGPAELGFLQEVLHSGALLEDEHFPIAEQILRSFLRREQVAAESWVVLNGLPRHVGQAAALTPILPIATVLALECDAATVRQRIVSNVGGDRTHRVDDDLASIAKKLQLYRTRSAPLLAFCQEQGASLVRLAVTATMTPSQMWAALAAANAP